MPVPLHMHPLPHRTLLSLTYSCLLPPPPPTLFYFRFSFHSHSLSSSFPSIPFPTLYPPPRTFFPPTPSRSHISIFISSSACPCPFPSNPTLLALSSHFQYISHQSRLHAKRRGTR